MSRLEKTIAAAGLFGIVVAGTYVVDTVLPENYETEKKFGAQIMYDRSGEVYVNGRPEDLVRYLLNTTDEVTLRHTLYSVGGSNEQK